MEPLGHVPPDMDGYFGDEVVEGGECMEMRVKV